jgi:peptidyl-prolyl cis-trans isomerase SurA
MRVLIAALFGAVLVTFALPSAAQSDDAPVKGQTVATADPTTNSDGSAAASAVDGTPPADIDIEDGVAATVNDQPISDYEVRQRMDLNAALSGVQMTPEIMKRMRAAALDTLEEEKLELQEAQKNHISVSPAEVDKRINQMVADAHVDRAKLHEILAGAGVEDTTLRAWIAAQIAWTKTVEDQYSDRVTVTDADVDAELNREAQGANKRHYLVEEIFLPVDSPDQEGKVLKDAQNIESQIQAGGQFTSLARQYSQSPSAANGGDIGWIYDGQLAPELNTELAKMTTGAVSAPVRAIGGYYILALRAVQEPVGTKVPEVQQDTNPAGMMPLARVLLPLGPNPTQQIAEGALKVAAELRPHILNCDHLDKIPVAIKGAVYMNLGMMKVSDLSADMQAVLAKTKSGEVAAPFLSPAGIELIVRCDKRQPVVNVFQMPTRAQVQDRLFDQQITAYANRYKRDLKRDADIDAR